MNISEKISDNYFKQDYKEPEYVFHGSRELYDVLSPRKANCDSFNEKNQQTAIYGSSIFNGAVPYAIKGKGQYDCTIGYKPDDLTMKISYGTIPEDDYGYIYVCDSSDFIRCDDTCQFVAYNEIKPIEVIKIYYIDFKECFEYIDKKEESIIKK